MDKTRSVLGTVNNHGMAILKSTGLNIEFEPEGSVLKSGEVTTWSAWLVNYSEGCPVSSYAISDGNYRGD